ncbi:unnamed protein product [Durusdinium trenchii]|uniref:ERAD-associated E3 ubiquitin-protein ligase DOA10 n=2 Tax=Durusdinium trenchii TaxID=1381693 RepID=A0ABP0I299_9DINO
MFCQELAQKTAESEAAYRAMQAADQAAYRAETERLADNFVAATMEEFMQKCNQAAEQWQLNCSLTIEIQDLCDRDGGKELVVKKFKKQMAELGFLKGVGVPYVFLHGVRYPYKKHRDYIAHILLNSNAGPLILMAVLLAVMLGWMIQLMMNGGKPDLRVFLELQGNWNAKACRVEKPMPGGTLITCPICHEHRPGVALVPCGHVICRDCPSGQRMRRCPMCRESISAATRGLFLD